MLLLKTQARTLDVACSYSEEQAVYSLSECQIERQHFLGKKKIHLTLIFFFFFFGQKHVEKTNCVL